ncbi:MAG TPA: hypothetical protein VIF62_24925 [Labilithrix sp.]
MIRSLALGIACSLFVVACGGGVASVPDDQGGGGSGAGASSGASGGAGAGASSGMVGSSGGGSSSSGSTPGSSSGGSSSSSSSGATPPPPANPPPVVVPPSDLSLGSTGNVGGAAGTYTASIDSANTVDGSASEVLAASADATQNAWGETRGYKEIDSSYWNKRYRMSAKIKTENAGYASLFFEIDTPPASYVVDNMMTPTDRSIKGTTDWQLVQLVLDVPNGAVDFSFGSDLVGAGKVWVGPITFEEVPTSVPTTPHAFGGTSP